MKNKFVVGLVVSFIVLVIWKHWPVKSPFGDWSQICTEEGCIDVWKLSGDSRSTEHGRAHRMDIEVEFFADRIPEYYMELSTDANCYSGPIVIDYIFDEGKRTQPIRYEKSLVEGTGFGARIKLIAMQFFFNDSSAVEIRATDVCGIVSEGIFRTEGIDKLIEEYRHAGRSL